MGIIPQYWDRASDLNTWSRWMGPLWLLVLIGAIVVLQQVARSFRDERLAEVPTARARNEDVRAPGISELTVEAKAMVRLSRLGADNSEEYQQDIAAEFREFEKIAETRVDRLRAAVVAGELLGRDEALSRLRALGDEAGPDSALAGDIHWFTRAYADPPDVPEDARKALVARHGWFASLAFANGLADDHPDRRSVVGNGERIVTLNLVLLGVFVVTGIAAILLLAATVSAMRRGEFESDLEISELPGGVYLEMFLVFLALFTVLLGLQIFTMWLSGPSSVGGMAVCELLMWLLPLSLLWPRLRGLDWSDVAADLGLTGWSDARVEVRAGLFGYVASLPVILLVGYLAHYVEGEGSTGGYSAFESSLGNSWVPVILGTLGAVVWAPVTEEIMVRGAFYRALRGRLGVTLSVIISAAVFGAIHPYSGAGLFTVGVSGVVLALLREWRGSLIAPVTAHFLNNATISGLSIAYLLAID